jgi:molecular chaperone DnaK
LQCEATTRAAARAGLRNAPLLQEPVATALAYGADPKAADQRWMIFDLGGGTLDIAIVSTRNGRLAVLEHRGDNRLGGKDMDRAIAMDILLPALAADYALPDAQKQSAAYNALVRKLIRQAEAAKKNLSNDAATTIALVDLGRDLQGRPISARVPLSRSQMAAVIEPLLDRCLKLVHLALKQARIEASGLTCVIGVGGPMRMTCIQEMLQSTLGVPVRRDLDPMTVVSQGAARFAAVNNCVGGVVERTDAGSAVDGRGPRGRIDKVPISISHERSSATEQSPVGITVPRSAGIETIQIYTSADRYVWESGPIPATNVKLNSRAAVTRFTVKATGKNGAEIAVDPTGFSVALASTLTAAPLPHTIAVELVDIHGNTVYEPIFPRDTPLPAEITRSYRADSALRPSDPDGRLPIKFWEVDVSEDASERWWCGGIEIPAAELTRPIAEGTEIQLRIQIDPSRKIRVDASVPAIRQTFSRNVYLPDPPSASSHLQAQLDNCFERIRRAWMRVYQSQREDLQKMLNMIQGELDRIALEAQQSMGTSARIDPDILLREGATLRALRIKLTHVEEQLVSAIDPQVLQHAEWVAMSTRRLAQESGTREEQDKCNELITQLQGYISRGDSRGVRWVTQSLKTLHTAIAEHSPEFWDNWLDQLNVLGKDHFVSRHEGEQWLAKANNAKGKSQTAEMRRCIRQLWALMPDTEFKTRNTENRSGLRGG